MIKYSNFVKLNYSCVLLVNSKFFLLSFWTMAELKSWKYELLWKLQGTKNGLPLSYYNYFDGEPSTTWILDLLSVFSVIPLTRISVFIFAPFHLKRPLNFIPLDATRLRHVGAATFECQLTAFKTSTWLYLEDDVVRFFLLLFATPSLPAIIN